MFLHSPPRNQYLTISQSPRDRCALPKCLIDKRLSIKKIHTALYWHLQLTTDCWRSTHISRNLKTQIRMWSQPYLLKQHARVSRFYLNRVLVWSRSLQLQNPALRTRPGGKQQMPAGTNHCGSYKSPGPGERTVIHSRLMGDGELVFFPPSLPVYPALSQSAYTSLHQAAGLSNQFHMHTERVWWEVGGGVGMIDRLFLLRTFFFFRWIESCYKEKLLKEKQYVYGFHCHYEPWVVYH